MMRTNRGVVSICFCALIESALFEVRTKRGIPEFRNIPISWRFFGELLDVQTKQSVLSKKSFFFTLPHWWGKDWPQRTTKKAFPKKEEDTAPNEYSWTNLYLMSILSRLLLLLLGKAEKRLQRGASRLSRRPFSKAELYLKVKRERV